MLSKTKAVVWMCLLFIGLAFLLAHAVATPSRSSELNQLSDAKLQTIVWTSQIEEAEAFYRDVLGLSLLAVSDGATVFAVGEGVLRVSPVPSTEPSPHTVLGFEVLDVDAVVSSLRERGVEFETFQGFSHDAHGVITTPDGSRVAWFRDPDGNLLSVVRYSDGP